MASSGDIQPFNFSKAATQQKPIPNGNMELVFLKHDMKVVQSGKNAGAPMVVVQAKPYAEYHAPYKNAPLFRNIPLIAPDEDAGERGTYWVMNQFLEALGLSEDELVAFDLNTLPQYYGRRFVATISSREWEGETRNEFNKFKLSTGEPPEGMVPNDTEEDTGEMATSGRSRLR